MINRDCPFCNDAFKKLERWELANDTVSFVPLNPVTPGHRLFVPTQHYEHDDVGATKAFGKAMEAAHAFAVRENTFSGSDYFNLITSFGADATQTVPHIHVHYVPRRKGDGLQLPWGLPHAS